MEDTREFIYACDHMGGAIWAAITRWAEQGVTDEVVRCRDCEYRGAGKWGADTYPVCTLRRPAHPVTDDDYCSWGRRREG